MIIWLASYPRSGNTLLRTVLKKCLNLDSYADEPIHRESVLRDDNDLIGHRELPNDWPAFYQMASQSPQLYLVKTHLPPCDDQPYLYVVRDGRSAIQSYVKYYEEFLPGEKTSVLKLIMGDDAYGDWSSHYRAWVNREGVQGTVIRFEDLVDAEQPLLEGLAKFLRFDGAIRPWKNPFNDLSNVEPGFFRRGDKAFVPMAEWNEVSNTLFTYLHGDLMNRLGFDFQDVARHLHDISLLDALVPYAKNLLQRVTDLQNVCDERLVVIRELKEEADKRLEIIRRFPFVRR